MGGNDYIISVRPDEKRLIRPYLESQSRGLGGVFRAIGNALFPQANSLIQLPSVKLTEDLLGAFTIWIGHRLPNPSPATRAFLDTYINDIGGEVSLLGKAPEQGTQPRAGDWSLHISFSGAGGTAEVSSLLACHWVDLWWREKRESITRDILEPFGVSLQGQEDENIHYGQFIPADEFGYALYLPPGSEMDSPAGKSSFMLDGFLEDYHSPEETAQAYQRLQSRAPISDLAAGRCMCQMCHGAA